MDYSKKSKEELIEELKFLKKKEEIISLVLDDTNEIIYHVSYDKDNNKHFEYVSPHVERVMGISTKTYIDANYKNKILEYFHPDDVKNLVTLSKKITFKEREHSFIYRFFNKKLKKYIWIEENIVAVYGKNKKRTAIYGTAKDITEKIHFEEKIKISEKSYKDLFDNSPDLLYIQSKEGDFIDVNKAVLRKYGYSKNELLGKTPLFLGAPEKNNLDLILKKIKLAWEGKKQTFEFWAIKKNGVIFPKEVVVRKGNYFGEDIILASARDITKQKVVEGHLKENEEKYRNIFSKNLAGVFITENNKIIDCNNSFAKIFGYKSRVELIGKSVDNLYFSKKDREVYIKSLRKKGILTNYRIRHKNKQGNEIWISTNVSLKKEGRIEGTLVGISEQIEVEKRLKQSEKNYKDLTENSPYGIFVHTNGKIIYGNKQAYKIWGLKSKTEKKLTLHDFILPENKKEAAERTKRALLGENVPFKEFKIKKPFTNAIIYVEAKPTLFEFQGEKAIQVVFNDITNEKELSKEKLRATIAEESNKMLQKEISERRKIEKKLIENQKYTNSIISSSLDIICASDKNGKIIEFNSAAEQAFGYREAAVKEKGVHLIYASKKEYLKVSKQLKETGAFVGEVRNKRKNGERFTSFLSASVLYNERGEHIGTMGVSRDITELKEAEQQLIESEEKYRDLFENATDLIQSLDMKGNILYVNDAWKNTVGYSEKEIENKNIFEVIHPDCRGRCEKLFKEISKNAEGETKKISYELKSKKGEKIILEGNVSLKFKKGKPVSTRAILRNITDEIWENTKQLVYNNIAKIITEKVSPEEIYEGIRKELGKVMNTDVFVISYSLNEDTITFPYYYDMVKGGGVVDKKDRNKGSGINEFILKQKTSKLLKREELDKIINKGGYKLLGQKSQVFVGIPLKIKNKTVGVLSVQSYTNENEYNEKSVEILDFISGALALAVQRKVDENKIFEQASRLKAIIENSTHLFWTYDNDKGVTSSNKNFIDYINEAYNKKVDIKKEDKKKLRFSTEELYSFWDDKYEKAYKGKPQYFISKKQNNKGEEIVKEVFLNPIYDNIGEVSEISGIAHDITEKTLSEQKLKESLKEKEVLLKEVHHRVKNNLQVISSILNLQSSYVKDKKTLNILRESQNRIKSMAFIHESLYQTNDFSKINFSEYITSLSKNLVHSYGAYDNLIDLNLSVGNVSLNLDISIPCGLIINELVSNSLKYAFVNNEKGAINIELFEKNGDVHLIVQDNGLGLPKEINYKNTDSLGLQLVMTLVEQISGTIKLDNKKGAKYTIIFKKE